MSLLKFLGSGSSFVSFDENYHSQMLLIQNIKDKTTNTLIDAGSSISEALKFHNIPLEEIDDILITHNHGDNVHGLEFIGFKTYFANMRKIKLISPAPILETLWTHILSGTMKYLNGLTVSLSDYFVVCPTKPKEQIEIGNCRIQYIKVPHIITDNDEIPAYGISIHTKQNKKILITGDTQFDYWRFAGFYELYDCIFHDVEFADYPNGVHAQFHQMLKLPKEIRSKIWFYHYILNDKTYEELQNDVIGAGFAGLVARGDVFDLNKTERVI